MPDILLRRFVDVACAMFFAFFGAMHDPRIALLLCERGAFPGNTYPKSNCAKSKSSLRP